MSLVPVFDDTWVWRDGAFPEFSVKSAYGVLKGHSEGELSNLYKFFWSIKALPAAQVLTWRVLENKIATKVNLARRKVMTDVLVYCFCRLKEESTSHLLFDCRIAWLVWVQCFAWLGVSSVVPIDPISHFTHICNAINPFISVLGSVWISMVRDIWCHRNKVIFKGGVVDHSEIFTLAQLKAWSWVTSKIPSACFSFSDWCLAPLSCLKSI